MADDYYTNLAVGGLKTLKDVIGLKAFWRDIRMEYSGRDLIYRGVHYLHNPDTSESSWEIWKYTWDGRNLVRLEGPLPGVWDDRATLTWG